MCVMGPAFKQRHLSLLGLNAKTSFMIICKYLLCDEFFCLKKRRQAARLLPGSRLVSKPGAFRYT